MKHPEVTDICDMARLLFPWCPTVAFELTAIMLLLNNTFLVGFHVFTGAKSKSAHSNLMDGELTGSVFNTLTEGGACTVLFQGVTAIIGSKSNPSHGVGMS
jgi:hypothetical protein